MNLKIEKRINCQRKKDIYLFFSLSIRFLFPVKKKNHFDSTRLLVIIKIGRKLIKVALLSSSKRERESVFVAKISCKQIFKQKQKNKNNPNIL